MGGFSSSLPCLHSNRLSPRTTAFSGRYSCPCCNKQVLEAARAAGAFVPTLCAHPKIPARASCRVCLVEVPGESKLIPACTSAVREGMKVLTHSPKVVENVRFVLQLLRAKHPNACMTCDADGDCTFQDLIYRFQVEDVAPGGVRKRFEHTHEWDDCPIVGAATDRQEADPPGAFNAIHLDRDKCIKCGRCVTVCEKVQGIGEVPSHLQGSHGLLSKTFSFLCSGQPRSV
jgi:NADH dehydrogenase/NADH:ubiquinone oxidoreductase subunit G